MLTPHEVLKYEVIDAARALVLAEGRAERRRKMAALRRAVSDLEAWRRERPQGDATAQAS